MKLKTKYGELEGGQREIRDFCKSIDFDATQFFQVEKKVPIAWILLPLSLYIIMAVVLVLMPQQNPKTIKLLTFIALVLMVFIVGGVHLHLKNGWVSTFVALIFLLTLAILMGWVEPHEAVKKLTDIYNHSK